MTGELASFYRQVVGLQDEALLRELVRHSEVRTVAKEVVFQWAGEVCPRVELLIEGMVRGFFVDCSGKEVTDCLVFQPGAPLVSGFYLGGRSVLSLVTLEESTVVSVPLSYLKQHMDNPALLQVYVRFLSDSLQRHWENKLMLAQFTVRQRYDWFLEMYPGVIDRVNLRYIASFLGMTAVSLSRIRRQLRNEQESGAGQGER